MGSDLRRWEAADREALERALAEVEAERDRLRRELEAFAREVERMEESTRDGFAITVVARIDAILRGKS